MCDGSVALDSCYGMWRLAAQSTADDLQAGDMLSQQNHESHIKQKLPRDYGELESILCKLKRLHVIT